jgi:type II pantothenate kinase
MRELKIKQQKLNGSRPSELCVMATGGGAYKFYDKIREALGVDVLREDEMECLMIGKAPPTATVNSSTILQSSS